PPDVILAIADASNLERHLYLVTQLLEIGVPVVIALNMMDVAANHGIRVDAERLRKQLCIPVVPIQANKGIGLKELEESVVSAAGCGSAPRRAAFPDVFENEVTALHQSLPGLSPFLVRRLLLDVGGYTERSLTQNNGHNLGDHLRAARERLQKAGCPIPAVEA